MAPNYAKMEVSEDTGLGTDKEEMHTQSLRMQEFMSASFAVCIYNLCCRWKDVEQ